MQNATGTSPSAAGPQTAAPPPVLKLVSQPNDQKRQGEQQPQPQAYTVKSDGESFWVRTTTDPISAFTLALVFLNFFLVVASTLQWRAIKRQVDLARDEFAATHRPRLRVRGFHLTSSVDLNADEPVRATLMAQNIGDSPAVLREVRSATYICGNKERLPGDLSFPDRDILSLTLQSGTFELVPLNGGDSPTSDESNAIWNGDKALYFLGTLTYTDTVGTTDRIVGFCRRYHSREQHWEKVEGDYEYEF